MRDQGTGWDPKAPASIHQVRAAIDASGNVIAYDFLSKGFSRVDVDTNGSKPKDTLAGQTLGVALKSGDGFGVPGEFLRLRQQAHRLGDDRAAARSRFAAAHLAHARSGRAADPFRQRIVHGRSGRGAERRPGRIPPALRQGRRATSPSSRRRRRRPAGRPGRRRARTRPATRSPAAASPTRSAAPTRVAVIAEVDVDRSTGKIWARKFTVAHDCGQIINPDGLHHAIENNIVQGTSRTLWEEVKFDNKTVTSVDWRTYPILDITEAPEQVDIVLINHPEIAPSGAGEAVEPAGRGGDRQRGVRRHRRAHPPRAVLAGQCEVGAVVRRLPFSAARGEVEERSDEGEGTSPLV